MRPFLAGCTAFALLVTATAGAEEPKPKAKPVWKAYAAVATLEGHKNLVRSVGFAPDGKTFATGGSDRSLRIWDAAKGSSVAVHLMPKSG